jgi:hypothetical protein
MNTNYSLVHYFQNITNNCILYEKFYTFILPKLSIMVKRRYNNNGLYKLTNFRLIKSKYVKIIMIINQFNN